MKYYYLAYGSNLNLRQMKERCPSAKEVGTALLQNHRLVYKGFKDDYAYLTVEEKEDSIVPIGVFKISEEDIPALDTYEGYPTLYDRVEVPIQMGKKQETAFIYVMTKDLSYHLPSKEYVNTCKQGYKDFRFNQKFLDQAYIDTSYLMKVTKNMTR